MFLQNLNFLLNLKSHLFQKNLNFHLYLKTHLNQNYH